MYKRIRLYILLLRLCGKELSFLSISPLNPAIRRHDVCGNRNRTKDGEFAVFAFIIHYFYEICLENFIPEHLSKTEYITGFPNIKKRPLHKKKPPRLHYLHFNHICGSGHTDGHTGSDNRNITFFKVSVFFGYINCMLEKSEYFLLLAHYQRRHTPG